MDYKLKNRDGVETTYAKDKIKIPAATGDSMVVFTQGELQAEKTVDIAKNGAFTVEPDAGYSFVKRVSGTVAVPTPAPVLQEKAVNITSNGQTSVTPDSGKDGLSKVDITVAVPTPAPKLQKKSISITANGSGSVLPDAGNDGLSEVDYTVNVPAATLEVKETDITENGFLRILPSDGYTGMSKVGASVKVPMVTFKTTQLAFAQAITDAIEFYGRGDYTGFVQSQSNYGGQGIPFAVNVNGSMTWGTMRAYETYSPSYSNAWEWWSTPIPDQYPEQPNNFTSFRIYKVSGTFEVKSLSSLGGMKCVPVNFAESLYKTQYYMVNNPEPASAGNAINRSTKSGLVNFNYDYSVGD